MKKILLSIFCIFSLYFIHNPNPYKTINKLLMDPLKEVRKYIAKMYFKKEMDDLKTKLAEKPKDWVMQQIKDDISHISTLPITEEALDETYKKLNRNDNMYIRVKIINNKVYTYAKAKISDLNSRKVYMLKVLDLITQNVTLPDVDVIIYTGDIVVTDISWSKAPILTFAVNKDHRDNRIMIPDSLTLHNWPEIYYSILELNKEIPWDKKINKGFWRGATTGSLFDENDYFNSYTSIVDEKNYAKLPRIKLVDFSNSHPDLVDARFTIITQAHSATMLILKQKYQLAPQASKNKHLKHKIQINIDGNSCTYPGFIWRLLSNSVTLKDETPDIQWFYNLFKPWKHYIPIKSDMSDIEDKIEWVRMHDSEAKEIAAQASSIVQENLKTSDMYMYFIALFHEYSKLQNFVPKYSTDLAPATEILNAKQ